MILLRKSKSFLVDYIRKGYWYNNKLFQDCEKFWNHKDFNLDIINLGSSSGVCAFDYGGLPIKAANWALLKNPLLADQEILNNYCSFLKEEGAIVIITLCPFTSLSGRYDVFDDRLYTILKLSSIPHYSIKKRDEVFDVMNHPLRYYPIYAILSDIQNRKPKEVIRTEEWMRKDAENWLDNWKREFSIDSFEYPLSLLNNDSIEEASRILNEMIAFCNVRNIRPILVIPPVYHTLGELFTPEIRKVVIDSLVDRVDDKDVWYRNYMESEFSNEITFFQNSFLMNKKGAKLFTRQLLRDLNYMP